MDISVQPTIPTLTVEAGPEGPAGAPVRRISPEGLRAIGVQLGRTFKQYASDRQESERRWLRNLRQYLGQYDPEIERELGAHRSKAYPRLTRVKCISTRSRVMNLMFPGNERNWELTASPSAEMAPEDVMLAVEQLLERMAKDGVTMELTDEMVQQAAQRLATERAAQLATMIDDQLQEIGGDQSQDYIGLNRKVIESGILYGLGVVRGPFVRTEARTTWRVEAGQAIPEQTTLYKPMFEFLPVWDFYPDLSSKTMAAMDGYFMRLVMSRAQVRELARREDFFGEAIRQYLSRTPGGNYRPQNFETELRTMGVRAQVSDTMPESGKYEVIIWNGMLSGEDLIRAGVEGVEDTQRGDDLEVEVWMVDDVVIKAVLNPWRALGLSVRTVHTFLFDENDTSPIGDGLPNVIRDSQMSVAAATRMLLDNASVVCGPNVEVNTDLLRLDQDISAIRAYKVWYREGQGPDAGTPAVRNIPFDAHMDELLKVVDLFMRFADMETFVGPATGGDVSQQPSEPMRTAAGASMVRGDAALPFKDIIRNFDTFTQSVITSIVQFNRKFNAARMPEGDFNVVARGATSLIAKEVRGGQLDQLATTLSPEERMHVDERKFVEQRFASRDLSHLLVPADEAARRMQQAATARQTQAAQQTELTKAEVRKTLADAFKGIAQGQKNSANADATAVKAALDLLQAGLDEPASEAVMEAPVAPAPPAAPALPMLGMPQ